MTMEKTNTGLVAYAKAQLGKPYWYGTFGQAASRSLYNQKKNQYPSYYQWEYAGETAKVHDCVGLIKGYLWCDSQEDNTPVYNAAQDISANGMRDACTKKDAISSIPEVPGVLVFMNNHVGVYIGNGEVIEARGHAYGVVKTELKNRAWQHWGYCPYIVYEAKQATSENTSEGEKTVNIEMTVLKTGAKGEQVKTLQRLLLALGYEMKSNGKTYGVDGSFGGATDTAVRAFQKAEGLTVDGSVGKATWTKLLKG